MAAPELPTFRYHPDPVSSGVFERLPGACRCCGVDRGWLYASTPHAAEDLHEALCPWCIADGSAARRFGATFNDLAWGVPDGVSSSIIDELTHRTPGFSAWQPERWQFHCGDAAAFLAVVGWPELQDHPDAIASIRTEVQSWGWPEDQCQVFLEALDVDGSPTAYLFGCLHCGAHLAYADMD